MELNALLTQAVALPSLPRAVALLMNELARDEPNLRRLNQAFGTDPALTARLLERANSPTFELPQQIAGIPEALALLGMAQLRALVASAPLGTTSRSVPGVNMQQFWRYSLNTAKLARSLAGIARQNQIAAYTAGLLHALGELVLHLADPERAQAVNALVAPFDLRRGRVEERICGYSYGHVAAELVRRWQLPEIVIDALQHQSAPFDDNVCEPLAGVIHLASWRARAHEAELGEKELAVLFPAEVGLALGLDIDMVLQQDPIDWTAVPDPVDYVI
ncbi:HDOD domain-containing protein [Verminephrobacter aporrectodeae]|uniref:HDOD domain-containing protein n=1 Tax=Verminephrobacter aporrectodeae subsp. tuberculatae TaxID=1110392 RepID=A0ABT3KU83_9BURK|nr:HDOD domain-containing protein [Verminephrobacter aporrectodeae]MCW5222892.1 HDOD domain-containing protein [Verminephrobacter aporrectodeae subsp. tuberculatae]MCW5256890.1 HDOD domain-containing protein [Verminephrobacter aporrectodeae subsp. tuberculatae]MCW5288356.1 HDOD domain-containing protein [Verminephrobacter aporrectodeae subsp. tuberculatae]MCW5321898.1 HDOD domain-containing protein [Verminephrobacter aporrectodeae subsp. tuberculatae]MCW8166488.1 HDOD domain-containing protein